METGKQKILITGASSGLGRELAHQFAQRKRGVDISCP